MPVIARCSDKGFGYVIWVYYWGYVEAANACHRSGQKATLRREHGLARRELRGAAHTHG